MRHFVSCNAKDEMLGMERTGVSAPSGLRLHFLLGSDASYGPSRLVQSSSYVHSDKIGFLYRPISRDDVSSHIAKLMTILQVLSCTPRIKRMPRLTPAFNVEWTMALSAVLVMFKIHRPFNPFYAPLRVIMPVVASVQRIF